MGIMTDDDGRPSAGRWMAFTSLVFAGIIAILPMVTDAQPADQMVIFYFVTGAFGRKTIQKFAENAKK